MGPAFLRMGGILDSWTEGMVNTAAMEMESLDWPLMRNNINRQDLDAVIEYLKQDDPILTHSKQVQAFEREWSDWLGVQHSVFLNSGASANLLTLGALREIEGPGEVIVSPLGWVSDIAAILQAGLVPVFVDIDPRTLGMDIGQVLEKLSDKTRAVLLVHVLGYNALTQRLIDELKSRGIHLIEDTCESHGATHQGQKLGSIGWASNFSFYYAHHLSTIEGGMISTSDSNLYQTVRMMRSHGMVREATDEALRQRYLKMSPDLNPDFIFAFPAYNVRPTEIGGIIGRSQLKRLDANNELRRRNLSLFLGNLDPERYWTDFAQEGSSNYAFTLVLRRPDDVLWERLSGRLRSWGVEFRRGLAGGGNQLRQPYLRRLFGDVECEKYPRVNHVHFYGCYIGNYPTLDPEKILELCRRLNGL
jgi:CDP-6-deoxy-D-xylo-4-hexulose-3-dehydrase